MWADQSKSGLNTYQNGSSGFQMDVVGGDTGFCKLHDTKNTKDLHKEGTDMTTNSKTRFTQLCNLLELHTTQEQTTFQVPSRMA